MADTTPPLSDVPLFKHLSAAALAEVSRLMITVRYKAGETVFLEREPGDALYVLESGRVRIWVRDGEGDDVTLTELEQGDFFGEMSVFDGARRSANATALVESTLLCLRRDRFEDFIVGHPEAALEVIRGLASRLRHTDALVAGRLTRNANVLHEQGLSALDRLAVAITNKVGSLGFFLIIAAWTICWTGYNLLASTIPALHWKAFDPFPAFVAYLLISNVIQILLMPLILVGQSLQSRHAETRAELDFEINKKAEREITTTLLQLERNTDLLVQLMQHLNCRVSEASTADPSRGSAAAASVARRPSPNRDVDQ